jgi:hypothetical protein
MKLLGAALLVSLFGCHHGPQGTLGESCKPDGTCIGAHLRCDLSNECAPMNIPLLVVDQRCRGEIDCFCKRCADSCVDGGMAECDFTDTSVWGAKPSVCKCR